MTNNKTWIEEIAEVINDKERITKKRITDTLAASVKEYKNKQGLASSDEYIDGWKVTLQQEDRFLNMESFDFEIGHSLSDDELKEDIQHALVDAFVNKLK